MFYQPESLRINPLTGVPYGYVRKEDLKFDLSVEGDDWNVDQALENLAYERAQHFGISLNDARLHLLNDREIECLYVPERDLGNDRYRREVTDSKVTFLFRDTEKVRRWRDVTYLELSHNEGFLILYSKIYWGGREGLFGQCVLDKNKHNYGYSGYGFHSTWWK